MDCYAYGPAVMAPGLESHGFTTVPPTRLDVPKMRLNVLDMRIGKRPKRLILLPR